MWTPPKTYFLDVSWSLGFRWVPEHFLQSYMSSTFTIARGTVGKEPAYQCRTHKRCGFDPWVRKNPRQRKWQSTPVFLAKKPHRQKSLAGYGPWGTKSWTQLSMHTCNREQNIKNSLICWPCLIELLLRSRPYLSPEHFNFTEHPPGVIHYPC